MRYVIVLLSLALLPLVAEAVTEQQINNLIAKTSENSATLKQMDKRLTLIEQDLRALSKRMDTNKSELSNRMDALSNRMDALSNRMDANKSELSNKIDTKFDTLFYTFVGLHLTTLLAVAGLWLKDRPRRATPTEPAASPESEPETLERLTPNV